MYLKELSYVSIISNIYRMKSLNFYSSRQCAIQMKHPPLLQFIPQLCDNSIKLDNWLIDE